MRIDSNLDDFYVVVDGNYNNEFHLSSGDSIQLETGIHQISMIAEKINDNVFNVTINPGETTTRFKNFHISRFFKATSSSYPRFKWNANLIVMSDKNADIFVDDTYVGTGLQGLLLDKGNYSISVKSDSYEKTITYSNYDKNLNVLNLHTLPTKKKAYAYSLIPGASQFYKQDYLKGVIFSVGFSALLVTSISYNHKLNQANKDSEQLLQNYRTATDVSLINQYASELEKRMGDSQTYADNTNMAMIATGGFYLLNILDAVLLQPRRGYYKGWDIDPFIDYEATEGRLYGIKISKDL